jgi:CBS domain-containing protein
MPAKGSTKNSKKMVRDVMTADPVCVTPDTTIMDAAKKMSSADIGDVLVRDGSKVCIVTDRDVVVRAIAEGRDPAKTFVRDICSTDVETVTPDTPIATAIGLMRDKAIRRLPVVEDGQAVGIVSLGDFAEEQDPKSALADISSAPPNN